MTQHHFNSIKYQDQQFTPEDDILLENILLEDILGDNVSDLPVEINTQ